VKGSWRVDRASLLVEVDAKATLGACEDAMRADGLTLGLEVIDRDVEVGAWLAAGAKGARDPWSDPADHLVAGLTATLRDGRTLTIRPTPRRAVGPDLIALVVGMNGRFARVERAWLRVHKQSAPRPMAHPLVAERNPPLSDDESKLLEAIERALS
jgi:alkyldihydroxyacetonephosphate synthase